MSENAELIERFYSSFAMHDYIGMGACYSPEIRFSDAVFTLKGKQAFAMWHMLCETGRELKITFRGVEANAERGKAHWEASYLFGPQARKVLNIIDAEFWFLDGRIVQHRDHFNFWRWSHQALGPAGTLLGWTPFIRKQVQERASGNLARFIEKHPEYQ